MTKLVPKRIIVHHSLTKDSGTVSWGAIRRYHVRELGWSDIGYHAGVEMVQSGGEFHHEALMGRMWDHQGAHTKDYNKGSLGICFVGNYDLLEPPEDMLMAGAKIIALWMRLFNIPMEEVYAHCFFNPAKTCPGDKFDLNILKVYVASFV